MKRTHNVLVDNGLFVLAYHLEKDIEDITKEDVFNSSDMMAEKIFEMLNCEKYANMKSMRFPNSALINPAFKSDRLGIFKQHMDEFKNEGTDTCVICGEKHANIELDIRGRSYFPNISGDNFVNFGNNHKGVNICPTCLLLSIYSVMNTRVNVNLYLFISNNDDFMMEYTYKRQDEVIQDIINKAEKEKKTETAIDVLIDLVENSKIYEEYIEIYRFNNEMIVEMKPIKIFSNIKMRLISLFLVPKVFKIPISCFLSITSIYDIIFIIIIVIVKADILKIIKT